MGVISKEEDLFVYYLIVLTLHAMHVTYILYEGIHTYLFIYICVMIAVFHFWLDLSVIISLLCTPVQIHHRIRNVPSCQTMCMVSLQAKRLTVGAETNLTVILTGNPISIIL